VGGGPEAVLIQLGDLHIGADWIDVDPLPRLSATVDAVCRLDIPVAAVLVLGDLAEHAADSEYADVQTQLKRLDAPTHVAMGNHDDRERVRRHFGIPPACGAPLNYATDVRAIHVIVVDTTIPGQDAGRLDSQTLSWLDLELSSCPQTPTVLAMHHPPLITGSAAWDRIALADESRARLAEMLARHPQVQTILGAHLHRPLLAEFANRPLVVAPSTYVQFPLSLDATQLDPDDEEPTGYVAHVITGGARLISSFQSLR
jgi:3',5'-cyclic AMP phosphodiesterase CpdA